MDDHQDAPSNARASSPLNQNPHAVDQASVAHSTRCRPSAYRLFVLRQRSQLPESQGTLLPPFIVLK